MQIIDADLREMKAEKSSIYYRALDSYLAESSLQNTIKVIPTWVYIVGANAVWVIVMLSLMVFFARRRIRERTASLEQSETRYRTLVENLPDLIFKLNRSYTFIDYHASLGSALYAPPEVFLGQKVADMLPPDLAKITVAYLEQAVATKKVVTYDYQLPMDGEVLDYEARVNAKNPDEIIVIVHDITDRKKAERELRVSEERYHNLSSLVPVGIFRTDPDGSTTYVNPAWCQISGLTPDEALGDGWLMAVHPDDLEGVKKRWQRSTRSNAGSNADYRFVHADGSVTWVIGQAVPEKDGAGNIIGYIGTITDITERRKVEELKEAVIRAESADRLKSAFLATMSHELRTPLNSIIGFTGILLQGMVGPLNDEQQKQLRMIQGSSHHLLDLINDVLDISKIEAGQMTFSPDHFDYLDAIQSSLDKIRPLAEKKGLKLTADLPPSPLEINSDRRRLEQVLLNLLNNAVKFTERGEVRLVCEVKSKKVITRVIDTGIGIKEEDHAILFKPFSQVDTGLTRQYEGTGLGLSICKRLVDLLGGDLSVKSTWGKGSEFSFTLPLQKEKK
jgi:PAS domain S-box-containing protein